MASSIQRLPRLGFLASSLAALALWGCGDSTVAPDSEAPSLDDADALAVVESIPEGEIPDDLLLFVGYGEEDHASRVERLRRFIRHLIAAIRETFEAVRESEDPRVRRLFHEVIADFREGIELLRHHEFRAGFRYLYEAVRELRELRHLLGLDEAFVSREGGSG